MLTRRKFSTYILLALSAGILSACVVTSISYPCPANGDAGCVAFDKAVLHPADLAMNLQGSLARFVFDLLAVTALVLGLLIARNAILDRKRNSHV